MSSRDLVFVSYSRRDTGFRDRLAVMLKPWIRRGLLYWADDYIQVGARWEREIAHALTRARVAVLFVSADFLASDFIVNEELPPLLQSADAGDLTLVCLLVSDCAYDVEGLGAYQFAHDPKRPLEGLSVEELNPILIGAAREIARAFGAQASSAPPSAIKLAAAAVATPVKTAPLGELHKLPELPVHYLVRASELAAVKRVLLQGPGAAVGIAASAGVVGISGLGGIGKSVLASAVARDEEVRRAFPDGVFFIPLGQTPDLTRLQNEFARGLGATDAGIREPLPGRDFLREQLRDRACLLLLDDLWQPEHAQAFDVLGPRGRALLTSRDAQLLRVVGAQPYDLGVLDKERALELLARGAGWSRGELPAAAMSVAAECAYLPLALALAAALVRDRLSFDDVLAALRKGRLEFLDHPSGSIWGTLAASVSALPAADVMRYQELSVVPEDTAMPVAVIARVWRARGGLEALETGELLVRLAEKSLLFLEGSGDDLAIRFHDLQLDYLRLLAAQDKAVLHGAIVDAVSGDLPRNEAGGPQWSALPSGEQYTWQYLGHHLVEAGRVDELAGLGRDINWMNAKLAVSGAAELQRELERIVEFTHGDEARTIERAVRLDVGWLHADPMALRSLLYNRLRSAGVESAAITLLVPGLDPPLRLRHPVRMDRGERRVYRGHTDRVTACAYSADGRRVLSASNDRTLREWDSRTGQELRRFEGHRDRVRACAYSPDQSRILSASDDWTMREWDCRTGQELSRFEGHSDDVRACAYRPDSNRVVSGCTDGSLREWDVRTGQERQRFEGHTSGVTACAYYRDGGRILSASRDATLREWDPRSGRESRRFEGHMSEVTACAYSPDGDRILSASYDRTLREWDARSGRELRRFEGHMIEVAGCAYSGDGARFLSAHYDGTLREWDARSGHELRWFEGHTTVVTACAYSPDGGRVLSASYDRTLREWDAHTGHQLKGAEGHTRGVTACCYSPDGSRILSGSNDRTLREWDARTGRELRRFEGHMSGVTACAYRPDANRVLSVSGDRTMREWDAHSGRELRRYEANTSDITACAYSADGNRILFARGDGTLREWHPQSGSELRRFEGHTDRASACAYSLDDTRVLSASADRTLREWDRRSGQELHRFAGHFARVSACTYSPDGSRILSASDDGTLREWDTRSGKELRRFEGHTSRVAACAYDRNGSRVFSSSQDGTLKSWSVTTGLCVATVYGIAAFRAVSAGASQIAAGDDAGNVWIMDWEDDSSRAGAALRTSA